MKGKKDKIFCLILLLISLNVIISLSNENPSKARKNFTYGKGSSNTEDLYISIGSNSDIIESVFDAKIQDYDNNGYYTQIYEPSLQATYYGLYTLNAIGKLYTINKTTVINYILTHYDSYSHRFMDSLSDRYLHTDSSRDWNYPFSSTLETTCYATLSLELLDSLSFIDTQDIVDYIWSCYNTDTSGFIGQPYDSSLPSLFKISTMDNTFFAVFTLDMLIDDWLMYISQKNEIIQFVNDLQVSGNSWQTGGFFNDYYTNFDSLLPFWEPNLLSSFYSIKTLEIFGMEDIINIPNFHKFLNNSYDSFLNYFHISPFEVSENQCNIVGTALGLELSDITDFTDFDRADVINFILSNRNSFGCWDQSTTITHHELIDTFQIIRSLQNSGVISQLTLTEKNQIGNATDLFVQENGYSLISEDYTSMNLVNTIIRSFELYGRLADIDIEGLYSNIKNSYTENYQEVFTNSFIAYLEKVEDLAGLRSSPIEFYSNKSIIHSHKTTYHALDSLKRIYKLDDFLNDIDKDELISDIVATQFLNESYYETYGAFSLYWPYNSYYSSSFINSNILFEHSYYAIKCLELISYELGLGNMSSLGVNTLALYNYIERNTVESPTVLYVDPLYTNNVETILEYTYYMIYLLKTLNMYNKNNQKIITYVEANLNYSNIKNIYFSYKISEILNIDIEFDRQSTQQLVQDIYSEQYNEFYCTPNKKVKSHENFYYICYLARNSEIGITATYSSIIDLGSYNHIEVSLDNMILQDFGTYLTFKFDCNQLGTYLFSEQPDGTHIADILIPYDSLCYPLIDGYLRAYEGALVKAEQYISFETNYTLEHDLTIQDDEKSLNIILNASILSNGIYYPLNSPNAFCEIYLNDSFVSLLIFSHQNFTHYNLFTLNYDYINDTKYVFQIFLEDGISNSTQFIEETIFNTTNPRDPKDSDPDNPSDDPPNPDIKEKYEREIQIAILLAIIFLTTPGIVVFSSRKLKKIHNFKT
ncbi:MAG: hypothetical protein ACFFCE_19455 [Promethearchaeota archaeon]